MARWRTVLGQLGQMALLVLLAALTLVVTPTPARADANGWPSWWEGDCDANHWNTVAAAQGWTGPGAHRLGASYLGVPVCGPRRSGDGAPDVQWSRPGWGHFEWECVELAMRFMGQIYGVKAYGANGNAVVSSYTTAYGGNLQRINNGTAGVAPQPGDVISFDNPGSPSSHFGHAAVVASSAVDGNGNGTITLLSQNDTVDGWRRLTVTNWTVASFGYQVPYGWLHDPAGRGGVDVPSVPPIGSLDGVSRGPGGIRVTGWAIDPDTTQPIAVHVYVDVTGSALTANISRPDVGTAYPNFGPNHGYDVVVSAGPGVHSVCSYGINNASPGVNRKLGCTNFLVDSNPFGSLDSAMRSPNGIGVSGWAIDPDTARPIDVHVYVDGAGYQLGAAEAARSDIAAAFPGYGANHGYVTEVPASPGSHNVCAYAINTGAGANRLLACRTVVVDPDPAGSLDSVVGGVGSLRVTGWAIDPDTAAPTRVHVYVDQFGNDLGPVASQRDDVGAAFPWYGPNHGYDSVLWPATAGTHRVCAYAINTTGAGGNRLLGCQNVQVT